MVMGEKQPYLHRMKIGALQKKLTHRVCHSAEKYGLSGTGRGIKILVIDSGIPDHLAINGADTAPSVNFTNTSSDRDLIGHSTIISGIIAANDKSLFGVAPDSQLYFAKAVDDHANAKYDAVIASILWGVIKCVDIIILPMSSDIDSTVLHETIKKAYDAGICIICPTGDAAKTSFPAVYDEVFSVGGLTKGVERISVEGQANVPCEDVSSCYLEQTYVSASGSACGAAIVAGLCAVYLESMRAQKRKESPSEIYDALMTLEWGQ